MDWAPIGLAYQHDIGGLISASVICLLGLIVSRLVFNRARDARQAGRGSIATTLELGTALTVAITVWSAHFMALMAYDAGVPAYFEPLGILGSLTVTLVVMTISIRMSTLAVTPRDMMFATVARTVGFLAMHILAVMAIRASTSIHWSFNAVALGFAIYLAFSIGALRIHARGDVQGAVVAGVIGWTGLVLLYLISMSGFWIMPADDALGVVANGAPNHILMWALGAVLVAAAAAAAVTGFSYWSRSSALRQLNDAIDAMSDGLGFYDADDRLVLWNARYAEVNLEMAPHLKRGVSFEALLRVGIDQNLYAEAVGNEEDWIQQRLAARRRPSNGLEQRIGDDRWLRVQDRRTAEGGTVTVVSDITELKRDAQALAEARDAAEQANRSKSQFLANMSHEIRTPLNGIIGLTQALARTEVTEEQREMLDLVASSGTTLQTLLSDILDLARVESGKLQLNDEPFDLARAVSEAGQLYEASARDKGLGFTVDIAPEARLWVAGDVVRLKQVLTNLVSNAVKFTESGFVGLRAETGPARGGRPTLRFTVEDTGIGFDPETRARLFSRFEQADGAITRKFGGTGLGLAICRQLAEMMGGDLDCESELGGGSAFILTLPLRAVEAPAPAPADAGPVQAMGGGMRVLLADDHPTNRKVVELILAAANVELVSVEDGSKAVEAFRQGPYDLVLMDMQMPVMDGLEATREIRLHEALHGGPRARIIMLTANALPEHVAAGQAAGADGHLAKPFNTGDLLALVADGPVQSEAAAVA